MVGWMDGRPTPPGEGAELETEPTCYSPSLAPSTSVCHVRALGQKEGGSSPGSVPLSISFYLPNWLWLSRKLGTLLRHQPCTPSQSDLHLLMSEGVTLWDIQLELDTWGDVGPRVGTPG